MTVCSYFLEGRCRYGDKCWNEHPRGGRNQTSRGGGGSVNRVWVNPSQRSGGGVVQPSSFSRGGGDWGRGSSGSGRDDRTSNFSFTTQNRFSSLNTQSGYGRTGEGGGGDDISKQIEVIQKDMEALQSSGQWLFSCYSILKASITGFVELSPEELRMEYYTNRATGDVQSYVNSVQQLANQWRSRVQELRTMSATTRTAMIAELSNPRAQTSSGGGIFSSSSSSSTTGFGSSSSTTGFGSSSSTTGFGSSSSTTGFGSSSTTGFGSSSATGFGSSSTTGFGSSSATGFGSSSATGFGSSSTTGFGSSSTTGFGSSSATGFGSSSSATGFGSSSSGLHVGGFGTSVQSSAAGFSFSASSPGFGSSGAQPASSGFSSSAPSASTFSFTDPAGATASKSSATAFSFSSASEGGLGSSSAAPSSGGFGGFGGGASVSGSAEDKKSGGDDLYTPQSELTADELREFTAKQFKLGQIPLRPPPAELLNV